MEGKGAYLSTVWPMCDGKGWYLLDRERIYSWLICGFINGFLVNILSEKGIKLSAKNRKLKETVSMIIYS